MKIIFNKNKLQECIQTVKNIINPKTTLPILSNILVKAQNNKVEFISTDLEIGINYNVEGNILKEGIIGIYGKKIAEIIKELPEKEIIIEETDNTIDITCNKSIFKLSKIDINEFPLLPNIEEKSSFFEIEEKLLNEMIKKVIYAVSYDETRINLSGVCLIVNSDDIKMVATDGHRLIIIEEKLLKKYDIEKEVIIPIKILNELLKLFRNTNNLVKIDILENSIFFKFREIFLVSRLIDGKFINYKKYIPIYEKKIVINKDEMIGAIRRVSVLSNEKTNQIFININKEKIILTSNMLEIGEAQEEFELKSNIEEIKLSFNSIYFLDILRNIDTPEFIFEIKDEISATIIKPIDDKKYLCILMPMRI